MPAKRNAFQAIVAAMQGKRAAAAALARNG